MGFLKKSNAPSELPNLAIDSLGEEAPSEEIKKDIQPLPVQKDIPAAPEPQPVEQPSAPALDTEKKEETTERARVSEENIKKMLMF